MVNANAITDLMTKADQFVTFVEQIKKHNGSHFSIESKEYLDLKKAVNSCKKGLCSYPSSKKS